MSAVLLAFSLLCEGMAEYLSLNLRENIYKSLDVLSILGEHFILATYQPIPKSLASS